MAELDSYVLDLVILWPDLNSIKVLELNPYTQTTGPGFFNWERDAKLLQGHEPDADVLEFRVLREPLSEKTQLMQWSDLVQAAAAVEEEDGRCCVQ